MALTLGDMQRYAVETLRKDVVLIPFQFTTSGDGSAIASSVLPRGVSVAHSGTGEYTVTIPAAYAVLSANASLTPWIECAVALATSTTVTITLDAPAADTADTVVSGTITAAYTADR